MTDASTVWQGPVNRLVLAVNAAIWHLLQKLRGIALKGNALELDSFVNCLAERLGELDRECYPR